MGGRVLVLTLVTSALTALVVSNAYYKKKQFYPTVVYLLNSNRSLGVLYLQGFLAVYVLCDLMKRVFFGTLRAAEVEHLIESLWYAVLETFILLAAFHQELNFGFVSTVLTLFVVKSFHWLASDRVDFMERSPLITWLFHLRAVSLLVCLLGVDFFFVRRSWLSLSTRGPSVEIVFGLEYAIMLLNAVNTFAVYILHCINLYSDNSWENKPIYVRYVDIVVGFFKLLLYVSYMMFMLYVLFIPLHIARRVYVTAKNFQKSLLDLVNSRLAIRNLNTLCPDATEEELQEAHLCAICREEMVSRCKKLPCNHVFHTSCLRGWFQSQQSCPTCRMDVLNRATLSRLARNQPRRNLQQNNGIGQHGVAPPAPGVGQGFPQAPPPHPQMMFPPQMMPPMWPRMMAPPPQPHPPNQPPQQAQEEQGRTEDSGQPSVGGANQTDGGQTAAEREGGLGQREQGDGQSMANLQQQPPSMGGGGVGGQTTAGQPQHQGQGSYTLPPFPGSLPPFMGAMPPPPVFFPPAAMPPPYGFMGVGMPSGDAQRALSDDELKALEGMERANVEARIAALRDVQRLLDAAVMKLNQYSTVMTALGASGLVGPGFPGYPPPPQFQPFTTTTTSSTTSQTSTQPSAATEEVGGASSNDGAPPASQSSGASSTTATANETSPPSARSGLFESEKTLPSTLQQQLESQGSFAFSARSLSIAASVDGEGQEEEGEEQVGGVETSEGGGHPTTFTIGSEGDAKIMEMRQRRLQRFHSSPCQPSRQDSSSSSIETGQTGLASGATGQTGIGEGGATSSEGSDDHDETAK